MGGFGGAKAFVAFIREMPRLLEIMIEEQAISLASPGWQLRYPRRLIVTWHLWDPHRVTRASSNRVAQNSFLVVEYVQCGA